MEAAYWSLDRKMRRVWNFCCLQARTIDFLNLEDCISTRELGRKSDCFKSMGRAVNTYRSVIIADIITTIIGVGPLKYNSFMLLDFTVNTCT
jgi:hypothetical protein